MNESTAPLYEQSKHARTPAVTIAFYGLLLASAIFCLSLTQAECDLWGHLRFGLDALRDGGVTKVDPYSYLTAGTAWINHEWLAEGALALSYIAGGSFGITALRVSVAAAIFGIIIARLHRSGLPPLLIGSQVLLVLILVSFGLIPARPQMFTYLFFAIELWLLQEATSSTSRSPTWWRSFCMCCLPVLFCLWINAHGGVLAGLAILIIYFVAKVGIDWWHRKKDLLAVLGQNKGWIATVTASLVAAGLTPYGFELAAFLLQTGTVARPEIQEWQPLKIISIYGAAYFLLLIPTLLIMQKRMLREEPAKAAVLAACCLLPLLAQRHLPLAAIAMTMLAAPAAGRELSYVPRWYSKFDFPPNPALEKVLCAVFVVCATGMLACAYPKMQTIAVGSEPIAAVDLLKRSGVEGNMICFFDWGEYCIWHLEPRIKVSLDGRRETSYSPKVYAENIAFTYGVRQWDELLKDGSPSLALLSKNTAAYALMKLTKQWLVVYEDDDCVLMAKEGTPQWEKLSRTRPSTDLSAAKIFP